VIVVMNAEIDDVNAGVNVVNDVINLVTDHVIGESIGVVIDVNDDLIGQGIDWIATVIGLIRTPRRDSRWRSRWAMTTPARGSRNPVDWRGLPRLTVKP